LILEVSTGSGNDAWRRKDKLKVHIIVSQFLSTDKAALRNKAATERQGAETLSFIEKRNPVHVV
jgi:hypothetical protein